MSEVTNVLKYTLCLLSATSLLACAAAPPKALPPPQPLTATAQQADAQVKQTVVQREEKQRVLSTEPTFPGVETMSRSNIQNELKKVVSLFEEQDYDGAASELKQHLREVGRGRGGIDYRVQVYALNGHAQSMMGQAAAGERSYRRVISLWGRPRKMARSIRQTSKTAEEGDARVARAMDAFGEALFVVADKGRERVDNIALPYYGGTSEPAELQRYLDKEVGGWLRARDRAIKRVEHNYQKVAMLKPETPGRWLVAATARMAALHARTGYELRTVLAPAEWDGEGDSPHRDARGKVLSYQQLREAHQQRIEALAKPAEEKARELYARCVSLAAEHHVSNAFSESCSAWLKADGARK